MLGILITRGVVGTQGQADIYSRANTPVHVGKNLSGKRCSGAPAMFITLCPRVPVPNIRLPLHTILPSFHTNTSDITDLKIPIVIWVKPGVNKSVTRSILEEVFGYKILI